MQISSEAQDNIMIVRLEGNLDTNTSTEAHDYLNRAIDEGAAKVVVSFEKVDFVSSAGLRVLLATAKRLGGSGGTRARHTGQA
jgi:anti-sigma B factor antagonist